MQRLRAQLAAALAVACSLTSMARIVRADERTDARREFRAGMQAISDSQYDEGITYLERAYEILPHPNVLYNIGLAHMYAGRAQAALEYFERYRETAPPNDALEIDALIAKLRETKPLETPSAETPPAAPSEEPGVVVADADTSAALERAAGEVRRIAEEQNNDLLRAQAAQLEAALAARRAQPAPSAVSSAVEAPAEQEAAPPAPASAAQAQPPARAPAQGEARKAVYEEQVVSASRFSQSPLDAPNATAIITAQDIRMSGVLQLSQLLRRVAGVEVNTVTPSHSELAIRGLNRRTSNKVLLLWDGRQARKDFLGSIWLDALPILPDEIERIEIIRGPASALYGADAFSGVINVITRPASSASSFALARVGNHGQVQAGTSFSRRDGNLSYRASTGYTQTANSVSVVGGERVDVQSFSPDPSRALKFMMGNGDLSYSYAKDGVVALGGSYGGGDFTIQGLSRLGQVASKDSFEATAYGSLTTPVGIRLNANYDYVYGEPGAAWFAPNAIAQVSDIRQSLLDLDLSWSASGKVLVPHTLTLGVSYRFKHIDWDWLDAVHTQHHIGGYLQDVIQLARPLKLQLGARIDRHPLLDTLQFSPRGSLVYRFLGEQSIRVSGGRAFRSPSFLESYLLIYNETPLRGVTAWGKGNDRLDPESITSVELGYQNQQSDYFSLEINGYYNWIRDVILFTEVTEYRLRDFQRGDPLAGYNRAISAFPLSSLSFANERATYRQIGGELGIRVYPVAGLDLYANYAIHETAPVDKAKVDPARANEQQTSLHKVNAGVQYRSWFGTELSLDLSWFSDQLWIEQVTDVERGVRWQPYQQPSFLMLNARIGYRLFNDRLELGVSGTNLAFQDKRQHPLAQPIDTRVLGSAKVRF